jgi:hypothetical protein
VSCVTSNNCGGFSGLTQNIETEPFYGKGRGFSFFARRAGYRSK